MKRTGEKRNTQSMNPGFEDQKRPRFGWADAAMEMHRLGEDKPIFADMDDDPIPEFREE